MSEKWKGTQRALGGMNTCSKIAVAGSTGASHMESHRQGGAFDFIKSKIRSYYTQERPNLIYTATTALQKERTEGGGPTKRPVPGLLQRSGQVHWGRRAGAGFQKGKERLQRLLAPFCQFSLPLEPPSSQEGAQQGPGMPRRNPCAVGEKYPELANGPHPLVSHCLLGPLPSGSAPQEGKLCLGASPSEVWRDWQGTECLKAETTTGSSRCGWQPWSRPLPAALPADPHAIDLGLLVPTLIYSQTL